MAVKNSVHAIELASIASGSVSASYAVIDSSGIEKACFRLKVVNNSDKDVTVSFDGSTDHEYIVNATTEQFPAQDYAQPPNWVSLWPVGTKVYVKGVAGTGNIYLSGYYNEQ